MIRTISLSLFESVLGSNLVRSSEETRKCVLQTPFCATLVCSEAVWLPSFGACLQLELLLLELELLLLFSQEPSLSASSIISWFATNVVPSDLPLAEDIKSFVFYFIFRLSLIYVDCSKKGEELT